MMYLLRVQHEDVHDERERNDDAGEGEVVAHLVVSNPVQLRHLGLFAEGHDQCDDPRHEEQAQHLTFFLPKKKKQAYGNNSGCTL